MNIQLKIILFTTLSLVNLPVFSQQLSLKDSACSVQEIDSVITLPDSTNFSINRCYNPDAKGFTKILDRTLNLPSLIYDLKLVFADSSWFGFAFGQNNKNLYRFDFGNSVNNDPVITNIGNFNDRISNALGIEILRFKDSYIGGIVDQGNSAIFFLDFKNGIDSTPELIELNSQPEQNLPTTIAGYVSGDDIYFVNVAFFGSDATVFHFNNGISSFISSEKINLGYRPNAIEFFSDGNSQYFTIIPFNSSQIYVYEFSGSPSNIIQTMSSPTLINNARIAKILPRSNGVNILTTVNNKEIWGIEFYFDSKEFGESRQYSLNVPESLFCFDIAIKNDSVILVTPTNSNLSTHFLQNECKEAGVQSILINKTKNGNFISSFVDSLFIFPKLTNRIETKNLCTESNTTFFIDQPASADNYSWEIMNSTFSDSTIEIDYLDTASINVSLELIDTNNCTIQLDTSVFIFDKNDISTSFLVPDTICSLSSSMFSNTSSFQVDTIQKYLWTIESTSIDTILSEDLSYNFNDTNTHKIILTSIGISGCKQQDSISLTPLQGPPATFSVTDSCFGDTFVAFENSGDSSITKQEWWLSDTLLSTEQLISIPNNDFTTRNLVLKTYNNIGCQSVKEKTFEVYPLPIAAFDSTYFCLNQSKQILNRTTISDNTPLNYRWFYKNVELSTQENPELALTDLTDGNLKLISESFAGCKDTITRTLSLVPSPEAGFNFITSCLGEPTFFNDNSVEERTIDTWSWKLGNATLLGKDIEFTFSQADTFLVTLTVTDSLMCEDTISQEVIIDPLPLISFTSSHLCRGDISQFINTSNAFSDSIAETQWSFVGQGEILSGDTVEFIFPNSGTSLIQLNLTTQKGCKSSSSLPVTVNEVPTSSFLLPENIGAPTFVVIPENNSQNSSSYAWEILETTETSTEESPTFSLTDFGEYTLSLKTTSGNGCTDSSSAKITVVDPLIDLSLSNIKLTQNDDLTEISFNLTNLGNFALDSTILNINFGGVFTSQQVIPESLAPNETITMTLNQSVPNNQIDDLNFICLTSTANEVLTQEEQVENNSSCLILKEDIVVDRIHPMPVKDEFSISYFLPTESDVTIEIHNSLGLLMYSLEQENLSAGAQQELIDLTGFVNEFYVLTLKTPTDKITRRITKQ